MYVLVTIEKCSCYKHDLRSAHCLLAHDNCWRTITVVVKRLGKRDKPSDSLIDYLILQIMFMNVIQCVLFHISITDLLWRNLLKLCKET